MDNNIKGPTENKVDAHCRLTSIFSGFGGTVLNVASGRVHVAQGQEVKNVYRIDRGFVRICVYSEDGTRRIVAFCGAGSILGLDQLNNRYWSASVEAVTRCVFTSVPKALLTQKIEADGGVREGVMRALQMEIELREAHLVMMGVLPSSERVFSFLEAFSRMRGSDGFLALPMCRRDIGDYLGLSMETVSRSFTALREAERIELNGAEKFRMLDQSEPTISHKAA